MKGFTLIEMTVVLAIVLIISTMILANTQSFNSSILLRSLAYEVGLSLREAQLYGIAVKETAPGSNNFSAAYGVYMPASILNTPNATYQLFADLNNNGIYDASSNPADPVVENFSLQNNFTIKDFCATPPASAPQCASTGALHWIAVTFKRPNPDALITTDQGSNYSNLVITVSSQNGSIRTVSVYATGQIVVQ